MAAAAALASAARCDGRVKQRQLAQECTDDTNALDGDPRWIIWASSGLKIATFSKAELALL